METRPSRHITACHMLSRIHASLLSCECLLMDYFFHFETSLSFSCYILDLPSRAPLYLTNLRSLFSRTVGNRISLISKKNIRYEGTLYSINESDATVALQNVKSYGTEGREKTEKGCTLVPPQDAVHPYLLFRGCDIKDLHVHEQPKKEEPPKKTTSPKKAAPAPKEQAQQAKKEEAKKTEAKKSTKQQRPRQSNKSKAQVGTGASLLNRKERGTVDGGTLLSSQLGVSSTKTRVAPFHTHYYHFLTFAGMETPDGDFDIQSNLANFEKEDEESSDEEPDPGAYAKDDFFDSISCDAIDKRDGVDNRLRGADERSLNTETFGAASLNSQRRRRYGGRGGRGRGRGGRGGRSSRAPSRQNNRWQQDSGSRPRRSAQSAS